MKDPEVFCNQEDLWTRATEKYYEEVQPVEPYYVMWKPPGEGRPEFTLILPFTPKNRQVLIGWIAGMSDGANYGRMLAYKFPKETRVLGTQQMDTKIDQDPALSAQLSLWSQRGQKVIRGNALVIPVEDTLLYVEPIFLQADTAAYPELRVVMVMHGDRMSYTSSLDAALRGLVDGGAPPAAAAAGLPGVPEAPGGPGVTDGLAQRANEAYASYLRLLGEHRFHEAAAELEALSRTLEEFQGPSASLDERQRDAARDRSGPARRLRGRWPSNRARSRRTPHRQAHLSLLHGKPCPSSATPTFLQPHSKLGGPLPPSPSGSARSSISSTSSTSSAPTS
ncbi:hypothetical protein NQZ70_01123 [Sorangium sp. Soce836]|nr:hypothetical protein NQZ70_01123 [Sorangium sp. Soce836]